MSRVMGTYLWTAICYTNTCERKQRKKNIPINTGWLQSRRTCTDFNSIFRETFHSHMHKDELQPIKESIACALISSIKAQCHEHSRGKPRTANAFWVNPALIHNYEHVSCCRFPSAVFITISFIKAILDNNDFRPEFFPSKKRNFTLSYLSQFATTY